MALLSSTGPAHIFIVVPTVPFAVATKRTAGRTRAGTDVALVSVADLPAEVKLQKPEFLSSLLGPGFSNSYGTSRFVAPGGAAYLGTCEKAPRIIERPAWQPLFSDQGGTRVPFDIAYQGTEAFTFARMTRWNENVLSAIQSRPDPRGFRGINLGGDIGTLMLSEGLAYEVRIYFPYATKAIYTAAGMPPGYRFPASFLEGPDELDDLGTSPRIINLTFHHLRTFNPTTGIFGTYDHSVGDLPPVN
jgi:hypothetical protein